MRTFCLGVAFAFGGAMTALAVGQQPVDFDTQVMPVLTLHGCNAGSCHGAAIGRGGFKLSLLGSGPSADHQAIVKHLEGRRVNLSEPQKSLILRKPSEQVGHEGGLALPEDSPAFELIGRWISEGANRRSDRTLTRLQILPDTETLARPGDSVSIGVLASFNSQQPIDVTPWTVFQAADSDAVTIDSGEDDSDGRRFTVNRRGVHIVIARFLDRVMPIRLTVPMHDSAAESGHVKKFPVRNPIDQHINATIRSLNLPLSPPADDWAMVRRLTLDLTGRLPTADEARTYASDAAPDKRGRLILRLLDSDSFADYWSLKLANQLGIDSKQLQPKGADAYHRWLADRLRSDAPMDETAQLMLNSTGNSYLDGAVNFLRTGSNPGELAEQASRVFMGVRLRCANCHDHPLDHWKQDDYHGLAAIFAKLKRQPDGLVAVSSRGEVTHPVTGQAAIPRIPGDKYLDEDINGRAAFAEWLTAADNPYFAKAIVNRIWQQLMGRGLVDPVDDLRATNPATHPVLLAWLAQDFVDNGFRLKHSIALICGSAAYGRDSATVAGNESDSRFYSHAIIKSLEAEVVADAITDVTGVPLSTKSGPLPRTITLTNNRMNVPVLDVLGRCDRQEPCGESAESSASLARSLHLINGELVNSRVAAPGGRLHRLLAGTQDDADVLNEIFLWTMTRPRAAVKDYWRQQLASVKNAGETERAEFFEDVLWGLITSKSFATNH